MSAEWVTALATAGTFIVIAASAIAALLQLRHMRGSNQIAALTECREKLESQEFQNALEFVRTRLADVMREPSIIAKLENDPSTPREIRDAVYVGNFFESMGGFMRFNIIDRTIACDLWCGLVVSSWTFLLPITRIKRKYDEGLWENFEYLAAMSQAYMEKHPTSYPRGMRRMPITP